MENKYEFLFGSGLTLLSIALPVLDIIGKGTALVLAIVGVVLMIVSGRQVLRDRRDHIVNWWKRVKEVEIKFIPSDSGYCFDNVAEQGRTVTFYRWYRIAVHNSLSRPQTIRTELQSITPCPLPFNGVLPIALHIKDDNTPPYKREVSVPAKADQFFDVISYQFRSLDVGQTEDKLVIQHAVSGVIQELECGTYTLVVEAVGESESDWKTFQIGMNEKQKFYMRSLTM